MKHLTFSLMLFGIVVGVACVAQPALGISNKAYIAQQNLPLALNKLPHPPTYTPASDKAWAYQSYNFRGWHYSVAYIYDLRGGGWYPAGYSATRIRFDGQAIYSSQQLAYIKYQARQGLLPNCTSPSTRSGTAVAEPYGCIPSGGPGDGGGGGDSTPPAPPPISSFPPPDQPGDDVGDEETTHDNGEYYDTTITWIWRAYTYQGNVLHNWFVKDWQQLCKVCNFGGF